MRRARRRGGGKESLEAWVALGVRAAGMLPGERVGPPHLVHDGDTTVKATCLRARGEQVRRARRRVAVGGGKVWAYGCSPRLGIQAGGSRVDTMEDLCGSGANRYVWTRVAGLGTVARDGDIDPPLFSSRESGPFR